MAKRPLPPFAWVYVLPETQKPLPKWTGGNGRYGATVFESSRNKTTTWTVWKRRPRHKDGDLELKRGIARDVQAAKKMVEAFIDTLL